MEDRLNSGLYIEMGDERILQHAPALVEMAGVDRVTTWANACPGRTDLPRKLPEATHLTIAEVDASFESSGGGMHFVRTNRPGQGRLSPEPTIGLLVVMISPRRPDQAQALRDWADFVHLRHISEVGVPGYAMVTPYERRDAGDPRFLHCYEMDTDEPESAFQRMTPRVQELLGAPGTAAYDAWARHPALRIMYVNTFRRLSEARR